MEGVDAAVGRTMKMAGAGIRQDLRRIYSTPEEAERAIRERMRDRVALESWATMVTAKRDRELKAQGETYTFAAEYGAEFSFDHIPPAMRELAAQSVAAAMLVWEASQSGREAS